MYQCEVNTQQDYSTDKYQRLHECVVQSRHFIQKLATSQVKIESFVEYAHRVIDVPRSTCPRLQLNVRLRPRPLRNACGSVRIRKRVRARTRLVVASRRVLSYRLFSRPLSHYVLCM